MIASTFDKEMNAATESYNALVAKYEGNTPTDKNDFGECFCGIDAKSIKEVENDLKLGGFSGKIKDIKIRAAMMEAVISRPQIYLNNHNFGAADYIKSIINRVVLTKLYYRYHRKEFKLVYRMPSNGGNSIIIDNRITRTYVELPNQDYIDWSIVNLGINEVDEARLSELSPQAAELFITMAGAISDVYDDLGYRYFDTSDLANEFLFKYAVETHANTDKIANLAVEFNNIARLTDPKNENVLNVIRSGRYGGLYFDF